ncbi:MAG TPA: MarR family transcriptional regulator [Acidimicrobiales bacterium]
MTDVTASPPSPPLDVDDLTARLRVGLTRIGRKLRHQAASDLTPSQLSALAAVNRQGPLTLGHLADFEHVAPPSITKVVDNLESRGLVERQPDPTDRRVRHVSITATGEDLLAHTRARKDAWLATQLAELDPDQLARLAGGLEILEAFIAADPA